MSAGWTPEQIVKATRYGVCQFCGAPREHYFESNEYGSRSGIRCSADPEHNAWAVMDVEADRIYGGGIFDREGNPITYERWVELSTPEYRRIAFDTLPGGTEVSTIWLGWTAQSIDAQAPVGIFETAVLPKDGEPVLYRRGTEADARELHARIVEKLS